MNNKLETEFPNPMLLNPIAPCISIYMPTHRIIQDQKQDIIVFKNLVKEVEESLELKYSSSDILPLLTLLKQMETDFELWNHSMEGQVIFASLDEMIIYRIKDAFKPIAIVSNSFHIKPLIEYNQSLERFIILALEAESFAVYEGNHLELKSLVLPNETETTLSGVLGTQHTENYQTSGAYAGASNNSAFHGHGGKSDEVQIDREKFFRYVDRFVFEEISKNLKLPIILVTHIEHQTEFKKVSNNPMLLDECIDGTYQNIAQDNMKNEIKTIIDHRFNLMIDQKKEQYHNLFQKEQSSDQIIIVLKALLSSKVDTLMIEKDKIIPGKIDIDKQQFTPTDINDPQTDDLLDDMVQQALQTGTKVYILDKGQMPTTSGVAGIFRY